MKPKPARDEIRDQLVEQSEGLSPWQISLAVALRAKRLKDRAETLIGITIGAVTALLAASVSLKLALVLVAVSATTSVLFVVAAIKSKLTHLEHQQEATQGIKRVNLDEIDGVTTGEQ